MGSRACPALKEYCQGTLVLFRYLVKPNDLACCRHCVCTSNKQNLPMNKNTIAFALTSLAFTLSSLPLSAADKADPSVRLLVDRETAQIAEDERSFLDFLIFWRDEDPAGEIVDPIKEAQRLRLNTALGKPVTEGETPKIERRRKAPLEDLF